ncbi:MAG: c-type cytochrome biogenesis protein CcmI/CycH [Planctomycetota bacterium]|jgi:hypothetical protein
MRRSSVCALAAALVAGNFACKKDADEKGGLPPSEEWEAPSDPGPAPTVEAPQAAAADQAAAREPSDPQVGMRSNPHADKGADPHAGMGADPHAGLGLKPGSVAEHGLPSDDPNRPIDESKFLAGTITVGDDLAKRVKPGSVVFLSVHRFDPKTQGPSGAPLATEKLAAAQFPASFRLTERNAMGGGRFSGEVVITAWTDQDRDAISKQPGDLLGRVKASIPADGLRLMLDTVLE